MTQVNSWMHSQIWELKTKSREYSALDLGKMGTFRELGVWDDVTLLVGGTAGIWTESAHALLYWATHPSRGPTQTPLSRASYYLLFVGRNCPGPRYLCLSFVSCKMEDNSAYLTQSIKSRKPCYSTEEMLDKCSPAYYHCSLSGSGGWEDPSSSGNETCDHDAEAESTAGLPPTLFPRWFPCLQVPQRCSFLSPRAMTFS